MVFNDGESEDLSINFGVHVNAEEKDNDVPEDDVENEQGDNTNNRQIQDGPNDNVENEQEDGSNDNGNGGGQQPSQESTGSGSIDDS